jgi:hypothetical protein
MATCRFQLFIMSVAMVFLGCSSSSEPTEPDATRDADTGQDVSVPDSPDTDVLGRPDASPEADADDADAAIESDLTRDAPSELPEVADGALGTEADAEVDAGADTDMDTGAPLDADALADADALEWADAGPDCTGELQEWCPCEVNGSQCCTTIGEGLLCEPPPPFPPVHVESEYVWRVFYDCGCWPGPPCEDWPVYSLCTTSQR